MSTQSTDVDVCTLHLAHPKIAASDWVSPLICKMLGSKDYQDGEGEIQDTFREPGATDQTAILKLKWKGMKDDFARRVNTYQDPVLSEHAACGLACVLITQRAGMEITEVTQRGDRADYWLGNRELMLEVSGHANGTLATLIEEKKAQLQDNPYEADGYVCAAIFNENVACLKYYSYHEEA